MKISGPGPGSNSVHRAYEAVKLTIKALRAVRYWDIHVLISEVLGDNTCICEGLYPLGDGGAQFGCRLGRQRPSYLSEVVLCAD
jgi:hypothetical protein